MTFPRSSQELGRYALVLFLLAALVAAALGGVLRNDFVILDDREYITHNAVVQDGLTLRGVKAAFTNAMHAVNWHPMTWLSHMLDVELFGMRPAAHHAVALLLHAANTVALFALLRLLTGGFWKSAFVASLFAVHPLHVESVAWAAERKDVLSTFFMLCAALTYVRAVRRGTVAGSVAVPLFFALALMAKGMTVTLPFLLLLLDWWPLARWSLRTTRGSARGAFVLPPAALLQEKIPLFLLSAAGTAITYVVQNAGGSVSTSLPAYQRIANALTSFVRYLVMTLWPQGLAPFYPYPGEGLPVATVTGAIVILGVLTAGAIRAAAGRPHLLAGLLWYIGTLVPVIGLIQAGGQSHADRYTYIPLAGIFVAAAWELGRLAELDRRLRVAAVALPMAILLAFAAASRMQVALWRDSEALFSHAVRVDPENWMAWNILGVLQLEQGRAEEAGQLFKRTLAISPFSFDGNHNMGNALIALGRLEEGERFLREAVRIRPGDPVGNLHLGQSLVGLGRPDEALGFLERAVASNPYDAAAWASLGAVQLSVGRRAQAWEALENSLRLKPANPIAHYNLGVLLLSEGKTAAALDHFRAATEIEPGNWELQLKLGETLFEGGMIEEAVAHLERAVQAAPSSAAAQHNLGVALATAGRLGEAIGAFRAALAQAPGSFDTRLNLGMAFTELGDLEGAARELLEAAALNPGDSRVVSALALLRKKPHGEEAYQEALRGRSRVTGGPSP